MAKENRMISYNTSVKLAGQTVVIKRFSNKQLKNYLVKRSTGRVQEKTPGQIYLERKERFRKSNQRAKDNVYDLIACNCDKVDRVDYLGNKQRIKFMTLTFKEDITDLRQANAMFTDFMKRLSYHHFGVRKNVIKYLAVPELQGKEGWVRENKGVWHFHVVLFNCPFTSNKKEHGRPLESIWGNGFVFINALKRGKNGKDVDGAYVAGYITKYMTKEIEYSLENREMKLKKNDKIKEVYDFDTHEKLGLKGMKRYQASRGLKKPQRGYFKIDSMGYAELLSILRLAKHKKCEEFSKAYEREIRLDNGQVIKSHMFLNSFTVLMEHLEDLKGFIKELSRTSYNYKELDAIEPHKKGKFDRWDALYEWHAQKYLAWIDGQEFAWGDVV